MTRNRRAWLLGGAGAALVSAWAVYSWGLTWVGLALLDPAPLSVSSPGERAPIPNELLDRLDAGEEVHLSAAQLNSLVDPQYSLDVDAFEVGIDGPVATVDAALYAHRLGERWANVHVEVEAQVADGRFTHARVHTLQASGWELAGWLGEGDVAESLNQRVHWVPELAKILAQVEHAAIEDGVVTVELKPGIIELF